MVRVATAISAAVLAAVTLTACGQATPALKPPPPEEGAHAGSTTAATTTATTPTPTPTRYSYGRLSRSQAAAFASAVNLRPADVSEFTVARGPQPVAGEQRLERALLACVGVMNGHSELAQAVSKEFERAGRAGELGVSSSVSVARKPTTAVATLTAAPSPNARSCLERSLARDVGGAPGQGPSIRRLSVSPEKALAPGTNGGVALSVLAKVTLAGKTAPLNLDFYGFVCGQAQIGLFTTGLPGSFPAKVRRQLLSLLRERARAQGQCPRARPHA